MDCGCSASAFLGTGCPTGWALRSTSFGTTGIPIGGLLVITGSSDFVCGLVFCAPPTPLLRWAALTVTTGSSCSKSTRFGATRTIFVSVSLFLLAIMVFSTVLHQCLRRHCSLKSPQCPWMWLFPIILCWSFPVFLLVRVLSCAIAPPSL